MAKVLVVGGAGYIGGAVTDRLGETPHEFRVYDSLVYEESFRKPVDFVLGDIRDWDRLGPHLDWADVVIWLAAVVGDGACELDPDLTVEVNELSLKTLAGKFKGRIIFASTCSVYGAQDGLLTESSPLKPLSLYAETKLKAEKHLEDSNAAIFRLGTLFGVGDLFSRIRLDLVVNALTVKACLYGRVNVFGGAQYRPLLHVRDTAEAMVRNIETSNTGILNLHAENMAIKELADRLKGQFPKLEVNRTETKFQDSRNYRVSSDKAREAFGFDPKRGVDEGIREVRTLVEEGRIKNLSSSRHSNQRYLKGFLDKPSSPMGYEVAPEV